MVKFMHFSDTHLGNREYGESFRETDFYESFQEAVNIGISEHVDFFVHSGDLFDTWNPGNHALLMFKDFARQIAEANKRMYLIMGDHDRPKRRDDPASKIFDFLGVKLLDDGGESGERKKVLNVDGEDILLYGISNMKGLRKDLLKEEYLRAEKEAKAYSSSVLLSHQAISPYLHPEACEAKYDDLPKSFSYLAFGHIHDHLLRTKDYPIFSYAGSTDMTSSSEITKFIGQGKSVNIVDIKAGSVSVERIRLESTRFQMEVTSTFENYEDELEAFGRKYQSRFGEKKPLVLLTISGEADRDAVKRTLSKLSESYVFKRLIFEPVEKVSVERPNLNSLLDYFKSYFGNDTDKAGMANRMYETLRDYEYEDARRLILRELGIDFEVGKDDN